MMLYAQRYLIRAEWSDGSYDEYTRLTRWGAYRCYVDQTKIADEVDDDFVILTVVKLSPGGQEQWTVRRHDPSGAA
jgi:hypothetical protein